MKFTAEERRRYIDLFNSCRVQDARISLIDKYCDSIKANEARYHVVADGVGVPWFFVGVLSLMECNLSFQKHLHNGDSLKARTARVPAGRPIAGAPPFTWEASASDALAYKKFCNLADWSIPNMLYRLEAYNGFGYRAKRINMPSPYLWSFSCHYKRGKFASDGKYDPMLVSKQAGAATVLARLAERRIITLQPLLENSQVPFDPKTVSREAAALQRRLCEVSGISIDVDGRAGKQTDKAYFAVTGKHLLEFGG